MLFKLFKIQKYARDTFNTVKDPTHVRNIITEMILKTFTLFLILIVILTLAIGVVAIIFPHPALWVVFGLGAGISLGLMLLRFIVAMIIRRIVGRVYQEVRNFTSHS